MLKNKWKELLVITQIESLYQLHTTSFHYNKYQLIKGRGGGEDLQFFFQYALPHPSYFIDNFSSTQNISSAIFILPTCLHFAPVRVLSYSTYLYKQKNWNWWKSFSTLCAAPLCCARHLVFLQTSLEEWRKPTRT